MGIRYYAYPVDAVHGELARIAPRTFMSDDPLADAWGPSEDKPPMLYLDTCWGYLQELFGGADDHAARPAFNLVAGRVSMHSDGWESVVHALDPGQVAAVANDIATLLAGEGRGLVYLIE